MDANLTVFFQKGVKSLINIVVGNVGRADCDRSIDTPYLCSLTKFHARLCVPFLSRMQVFSKAESKSVGIEEV